MNDEVVTWLSVADLAKARGISKQAVIKRVNKLVAQGLLKTKRGARGQLINVGEFDRVTNETVDAIKLNVRNATTKAPAKGRERAPAKERPRDPPGDEDDFFSPVLAREQARRGAYQADFAKLQRDERLGKLLPIENIAEASAQCAEALNRVIDQLPARADEIAAAVAKEGASGVRAFLRSVARDMRERLADEMQRLATMSGEAPGL